jgi:hypothetical protein
MGLSKIIKNIDTINKEQTSGNKTFQPNDINWSYRKRGNVARTQINVNITNHNFRQYQTNPGIQLTNNGNKLEIKGKGNHPPKKIITNRFDITITCKYSPKNRNAKVIDEYSTLKPETSSDSASAKSNGALYVSAKVQINQISANGPLINKNQIL